MSNLSLILSIVLYRLVLDVNYAKIIYPYYAYSGFDNNISFFSYMMSWIIMILFIPYMFKFCYSNHFFFSNTIVLFYLVSFIPGLSLLAFMPMKIDFLILYVIYWFLFLYISKVSLRYNIKCPYLCLSKSKYVLILLTLMLVMAILYVSFKYTGFRLYFNLIDVYGLRSESIAWKMPSIFTYLLTSAGNVLPVLLMYCLMKKQYTISLFVIFIIFMNFSIGGHKSVIFKCFVCIIGYAFYNRKIILCYSWALFFLSFIALLEYYLFDTFTLNGMIIRRMLYIPSYINYQYYDFFSTHEFDYFRQSFLRHLGFVSPYDISIPYIIGDRYWGSEDTGANNGLFSDAFMNLGYIGIFLFPLFLVVVLRIMDFCSAKVSNKLLFMPVIVTVITFLSSSMTVGLLTGGLLLLSLVFLMISQN